MNIREKELENFKDLQEENRIKKTYVFTNAYKKIQEVKRILTVYIQENPVVRPMTFTINK